VQNWARRLLTLKKVRHSSALLTRTLCLLAVGLGIPSQIAADGGVHRRICPFVGGVWRKMEPAGALVKVIARRKEAWERSLGGAQAAKPHIQARLRGWPQRLLVDHASLPATDREFAMRVARDTWRGLDALTDRQNGLPVDNVRFAKASIDVGHARIGDYASGTDIGLHLIAIAAARSLDFIPQAQAVDRARRVLDTVAQLETYRGFFFNYYDTTSLERTSNFVSFVDSSWLSAGLMVTRMAFPELAAACTTLLERSNYGFFYARASGQISHGYYVNPGERSPYDYGMLYTEARLGSLIAIGKGDVPEAQWFDMARTFSADCAGQTLTPKMIKTKTVRGHEFAAGRYEWNGWRYVPSWGGSMFEALMPTLVLDEVQLAPKSLGVNDQVHAAAQRAYALERLGYPVWGLSPCATPLDDVYAEYGVKVLGARGYDAGAVAPYASALALSVTPAAALANLRRLAELYEIYGEYGFYDAVDPRRSAVAYEYLALDQSMLFIALANYLDDHYIQKRFAADPIMQKVLPIIADEDFFD
jgi:hypothetical protein